MKALYGWSREETREKTQMKKTANGASSIAMLKSIYNSLSKAEQKVADVVLGDVQNHGVFFRHGPGRESGSGGDDRHPILSKVGFSRVSGV